MKNCSYVSIIIERWDYRIWIKMIKKKTLVRSVIEKIENREKYIKKPEK